MRLVPLLLCTLLLSCSHQPALVVNVEEARLAAALVAMPGLLESNDGINKQYLDDLVTGLRNCPSMAEARILAAEIGSDIWSKATAQVTAGELDDRHLYWGRLYVQKQLREVSFDFSINTDQREELIELIELSSRGQSDVNFQTDSLHVLLTGFDPFLLDRYIEQVNPSGIVALALDGIELEIDGRKVEIQSAIMPVRYGDFDQGRFEAWLAPIYRRGNVDLVFTVSMGREHFDLERFPGLRRSATATGNLNLLSGGSAENPLKPDFPGDFQPVSEFVEFTLPAHAMAQASGAYSININSKVTTLEKGTFSAASLDELAGLTAVRGSGGGYLSNEISYRAINVMQHLGSKVPTGHIHTPRVENDDQETLSAILAQTKGMIKRAAVEINKGQAGSS